MRRYENITLNGQEFTLDTKTERAPIYDFKYNSLWSAYNKPSTAKQASWLAWLSWFVNNDGWCGVTSRNSFQFTISGIVYDHETKEPYFCEITASNNRCWKIGRGDAV